MLPEEEAKKLPPALEYAHLHGTGGDKAEEEGEDGEEEEEAGAEDDEEDVRRRLSHSPYDGSDKECPSADKIRSFTTAPKPGSDASVNLAFMGDLGQFPHSEDTMRRLLRSKGEIDAVILAGDLGYTGTYIAFVTLLRRLDRLS